MFCGMLAMMGKMVTLIWGRSSKTNSTLPLPLDGHIYTNHKKLWLVWLLLCLLGVALEWVIGDCQMHGTDILHAILMVKRGAKLGAYVFLKYIEKEIICTYFKYIISLGVLYHIPWPKYISTRLLPANGRNWPNSPLFRSLSRLIVEILQPRTQGILLQHGGGQRKWPGLWPFNNAIWLDMCWRLIMRSDNNFTCNWW